MTRTRFLIVTAALALAGLAAGCATPKRACVPTELSTSNLRDLEGAPACPTMPNPDLLLALQGAMDQSPGYNTVPNRPPQNYLALSGGGVFGSFTVGLLCGWTESGRRPPFDVVTGISTGALIATYAFLGPKYDDTLRDYYSNYSSKDVYATRRPLSLLWSDSAADDTPLKQKVSQALTDEVLAEVRAAHASGRRLYIGTTNLDTGKLVIWDMGAIASSGRPDARKLYLDVVIASASVPAFFPPVCIDVEINGQRYQEMHVDGGITAAVFFEPFMLNLDLANVRSRAGSNLYVVSAGKIYADPKCAEPRILKIAGTALRTMLYAGARNDLKRLYTLAQITGVNYNLAAVPQEFPVNLDSLNFDQKEMRRLYQEGYRQGRGGSDWHNRLDNIGLEEDITPRSGTRFQTVPVTRPEGR